MMNRTVTTEYLLVMANLAGQNVAEMFVTNLSAKMPVGDDLFLEIKFHANPVSNESAEWLRGFSRALQKRLEKLL